MNSTMLESLVVIGFLFAPVIGGLLAVRKGRSGPLWCMICLLPGVLIVMIFGLRYEWLAGISPFFVLAYIASYMRKQEKPQQPGGGRSWPGCLSLLGFIIAVGGFIYIQASPTMRYESAKGTLGTLGGMRSAISLYYGDMEGLYPEDLWSLTRQEKYLSKIPPVRTINHPETNDVTYFPALAPTDSGTWGYVNNPYSADWGAIFVDCTHSDIKGTAWFKY